MKIKKWLFFTILLCSSATVTALPKQNFAAWITHEMQHKHVPGASIAVIKNYRIEWAKGFGIADKKTKEPVMPNILFQAGSISKPITAMAALKLVQNGKLKFDENINSALTSWKVPDNLYTNKEKVTLRRLLSHTAGINVPGFLGYAKDEKAATLIETLNGAKPANSAAIRVVEQPGKRFKYSGGGYMIVQQTLMDIEQQPFTQVMDQLVLNPLSMSHSTFLQPLPPRLMKHIAIPYWTNRGPVPGGPRTYPEQAAAGLWTTPTDLAKFVISIQKSLKGDSGQILTRHSAELMAVNTAATTLNHSIGLGFNVHANKYGKPAAKGVYFTAMGQNEGYSSLLIGSIKGGNGLIIMINASPDHRVAANKKNQRNREFISAVIKKIVNAEGWS